MNLIKQVVEQQLTAGFKLEQEEDREDDNIKIYHYITDPTGKKHWLDHSPYEYIKSQTFADYVTYFKKHGKFPDRGDLNIFGPLHAEDVAKLAAK
jgi:hypothetical protein